ncbi:MAG: PmoA family protein, partial [Bacteroidales bacterium]|nr:PmoA family protein [Bacteroidales bacterium]
MKSSLFYIILFFLLNSTGLYAQDKVIVRLKVEAGSFERINTPVRLSLHSMGIETGNISLVLYELKEGTKKEVPSQLEAGPVDFLWWILEGTTSPGESRIFQIEQGSPSSDQDSIYTIPDHLSLSILKGENPILSYRHAIQYPPEGVDPIYKRSGFIHPLWSPSGNVLTRINPPDHYHHMGIWNPWTKTHYKDQQIDFWNLSLGQGTVRFAGFNSFSSGPVFGGFSVRQEHVAFFTPGEDMTLMNETWFVKTWNIRSGENDQVYIIDLTTILSCATNYPVMLDAYRYGGGIGFRATEEWVNDNSWAVTSEGKTRKDADASRARWVDVGGEFKESGTSGILFLSHPSNRDHPEPMRVWPPDANAGRGDMFFE